MRKRHLKVHGSENMGFADPEGCKRLAEILEQNINGAEFVFHQTNHRNFDFIKKDGKIKPNSKLERNLLSFPQFAYEGIYFSLIPDDVWGEITLKVPVSAIRSQKQAKIFIDENLYNARSFRVENIEITEFEVVNEN